MWSALLDGDASPGPFDAWSTRQSGGIGSIPPGAPGRPIGTSPDNDMNGLEGREVSNGQTEHPVGKWVAALGGVGAIVAVVAYVRPPPLTCAPSDTQECPCDRGVQGRKTCASDGRSWSPCTCPSMCAASAVTTCSCADGRPGERVCAGDGESWSSCECPRANGVATPVASGTSAGSQQEAPAAPNLPPKYRGAFCEWVRDDRELIVCHETKEECLTELNVTFDSECIDRPPRLYCLLTEFDRAEHTCFSTKAACTVRSGQKAALTGCVTYEP
jgi:hypothetical protein